MPSPTTVLEVCRQALALTNAVGIDQTLTAAESTDCLRAFNDLLEDFSNQNLAVYGIQNFTFNTISGQATYTIGTGGFLNVRPVRIHEWGYSTINGVDFPFREWTQDEYNLMGTKSIEQSFPSRYLYVNSFPYGLLTLWPVPSAIFPVTLTIDRVFETVDSINDSIAFPQGYAKVFSYRLAVELASMFGVKLSKYPQVVQIATDSFANLKRANKKPLVMQYDAAILTRHYGLPGFLQG